MCLHSLSKDPRNCGILMKFSSNFNKTLMNEMYIFTIHWITITKTITITITITKTKTITITITIPTTKTITITLIENINLIN